MSTKTDKTKPEVSDNDIHTSPVSLIDFMAGIAFLGYANNKFEGIHIPEGSNLGIEVGRESYAWAKAMCKAKENMQ